MTQRWRVLEAFVAAACLGLMLPPMVLLLFQCLTVGALVVVTHLAFVLLLVAVLLIGLRLGRWGERDRALRRCAELLRVEGVWRCPGCNVDLGALLRDRLEREAREARAEEIDK
jgi:uncharacterized membrane protein YidH (DUF202 family)